ncbi:MAG: FHA domain-containing protein [Holophagales bacterium]|nr:FHA domain-containing protein [Holophagales bacterium]
MAHVTVFGPGFGAEGRAIPLGEGDFSVGRDPASSLVLDERQVSRHHAVIRRGPSSWEARDLGSSNGIRVNGHRMEAALLSDGDEVRVGLFRLVFSPDASETPALLQTRRPPPPPPPTPPVVHRPARGPGRRPSPPAKRGNGLLVAGLTLAVLLPTLLAAVALLPGRKAPRAEPVASATAPPEATPAAPLLPDEPLPSATSWPPPPDPVIAAEVDRAAASLEAAFRAGNVAEVFVHVHPAATGSLRAAFGPRAAELPRVAALLASRKLVVAEEAWAEYEVTEDGRAFAVVFEKVEGRWLLSSL